MFSGSLVAVVDDDESVRESLPDLLREFGFDVEAYPSAETFLEADCSNRAECLILDIAMPGLSGIDLQSVLKDHKNPLSIIFVTAQQDESIRSLVLERGAIACLLKPFSDAVLLSALTLALRRI